MKEKKISLRSYIAVLVLIFVGAIWAFVHFSGQALAQFYIVIAAVVAHVGWGAVYHAVNKRLTSKVVAEYVFVAAIVLLLFTWAFLFS